MRYAPELHAEIARLRAEVDEANANLKHSHFGCGELNKENQHLRAEVEELNMLLAARSQDIERWANHADSANREAIHARAEMERLNMPHPAIDEYPRLWKENERLRAEVEWLRGTTGHTEECPKAAAVVRAAEDVWTFMGEDANPSSVWKSFGAALAACRGRA